MTDTTDLLARAIGAGYEIGELIGRGGFGEVYAAADRSLNRTVAIKVLRADVADSRTAVDRFRREAGALARLRHPHIMPVYGIGEGEGITYFVMPKIEGESLASLMERGDRLPLADACRVVAEAADALAAAHRAGVVHRDIKPDNILLEGTERHALLMDFGIAKSGGPGESRLTGTGMIIGTPMYMSPEQATGDHTGPASDIYSFGVVAYELLSGRALFGEVTSSQAVITAHLTRLPEDLRAANPEVPTAISRAVMKCLRKVPTDRWSSVDEFRQAFAKARDDIPRDPEVAIPDAPPKLRTRGAVLVAATGLIGLALAFAIPRMMGTPELDAPRLSREAAIGEARRIADSLGVPSYASLGSRFDGDGDHARFVANGGAVRFGDPALGRVRLGNWRVAFFSSGTRGYARMNVAAPGWITDFERVSDSLARQPAPVALDASRLKRTIALLGWAIDSLRLVDSSRATVGRHDQRSFTWEPLSPAPALIVGTDTAKRVIEATFVDGALTRYRARVLLPASATARADRKSTISATVIGALIAVLVLVLAVDLVRARRARTLRFERALRLGTATALLLTIGLIIGSRRSAGEFGVTFRPEDAAVGAVIGQYALLLLIIAPFAFLFATLVAAAAESVAIRRAPELLAGYQVVVAMPRPRRLATYLPAGTALGLGVAGLAALCAGAGAWLSGAPLGVGVSEIQTLADSIVQVGMSVALAPIAVLLVVLIVAHARAAGRLVGDVTSAVVVAALAGGLDFIASSNVPDSASAAAIAGGLALVVQRRGLVEGAIAFAVLELARAFIDAYLEPFAERWPPGIALGAMLVMAIGAMLVTPRRSAGTQSTSGAS